MSRNDGDGSSTAGLSIGVLGPVVAQHGSRPIDLGGPLQRAVLAVLVAADGTAVPASRIIDDVWAGDRPGARTSLRSYLSRLRRALEPEAAARTSTVIRRVGAGYRLDVPAAAIDARRFVALATSGDAALRGGDAEGALGMLRRALAEWRGEPYADVPAGSEVWAATARLQEARRGATENLLEARLRLGEHLAVVGELEALARLHPSSERAWWLLATALYRSGRQVDALDALRRARAELAEGHGLDPGHDLRELEAAILRHDPVLSPPASVAASADTAGRDPLLPPVETPPLPLTSFVGRTEELDRLTRLLRSERLVTLLGSGGAGKTRLALETVHRLSPAGGTGPDVCWVALGGVHEASLLAQAVSDAVGVTTLGTATTPHSLVPALRHRDALLVLDNCEHLADAVADLVSGILRSCPGVRVLATSREELRIPGEVLFDVHPLRVSDETGDDGEAVELFLRRAAQHVPADQLAGAAMELVRTLCRALDGLPLAIELAAARLRTMSLTELVAALDDRFAVLTNGPRTSLPHHRTLRETVAWSYALLPPEEQAAFRRLAVFEGFHLDAAAEVVGPDAVRLVHELASKSLVVVDRRPPIPRWCMLETLRAFAAEVTAEEERRDIAAEHLRWVERLAMDARSSLQSTELAPWIARLDIEQANVRTALEWAFDHDAATTAAAVTAALPWYWYRRGHTAEGRTWLERSLSAPLGDDLLRARLLHAVATLACLDGDLFRASGALEEAAALADSVDDADLRSRLYGHLGYIRAVDSDLPGALAIARAGLDVAVTADLPAAEAEALMNLGQLARFHDLEEAENLLNRAIELACAHDETWVAVSSRWILAKVALATGRPSTAVRLASEVVVTMAAQGDDTAVLAGLQTLAGALAAAGEGELGARLLGALDAIGDRTGYSPERMDPLDSPWIRQLVTDGTDTAGYRRAYEEGCRWTLTDAVAVADGILGSRTAARGVLSTPRR